MADPVDIGDATGRPRDVGHRPARLLAPALDVDNFPDLAGTAVLIFPVPVMASDHSATRVDPTQENSAGRTPGPHKNRIFTCYQELVLEVLLIQKKNNKNVRMGK